MKTVMAKVDGKEVEVVLEMDEEEKEYMLIEDDKEVTLDLTNILENTMEVEINND